MQLLIINQTEVASLLTMPECIAVMADTLKALSRGEALLPLRSVTWLPERVGALGVMPAYLDSLQVMGVKVISVFPGNHGTAYDSHMGAIMLFETVHGQPIALLDATEITAIRTAAVSGVATAALARPAAADLAIIGSGTQARTHLAAMMAVRPIRRIRVWSRHADNAHRFRDAEVSRCGIPVEVCASVEDAVHDAEIICTTTSSREPVLQGRWLAKGAHINAVGSSASFARELDSDAVVRSQLFVDRRESALNEAGDFLIPKAEGLITDDHIRGELGDLLLGKIPGRGDDVAITLFKSLGLAIEDVAAAHLVYRRSLERGFGVNVELGGGRHAGT